MRSIKLVNITKSYNSDIILKNFDLTIPEGSFFVLLGPSGCGKTTLLRLIDGFEQVDSGKIYLGNEDITEVPINKRNINTVFQNYALFPHLNVFDNIAYGLRIKKLDKKEIEQKVHKVLNSVNLEKHIYKSIQQLSGGQKQRVALARAIVNEPDVLLFDEPLAALDLKLRERMLIELIELQKTLKTTFVYVTHDQSEALAVANLIAVMNYDGKVEQIGSPKEIYEFPETAFVAKFIGTTNLFEAILQISGDTAFANVSGLGNFKISIDKSKKWIIDNNYILLSLRPEKIIITKKEFNDFDNKLNGLVTSSIYQGRSTLFNVRLDNKEIIQVFQQNMEHIQKETIKVGDNVNLYWQKDNVTLLQK
jgi:spermidine/putrescine transport system ATP-binding protein